MSAVADNKILTPVSVIMPAYNAAAYIEEAIRSVMAQTYGAWRLLVLDDGSADDTVGIVQRLAAEEPRITLLRNAENLGAARTRNRGWDLCDEGYVAFLDSDDRWHPEKLAAQMAEAGLLGGTKLHIHAVEGYLPHATVAELEELCGFTADTIAENITALLG